MKTAFHLTLPLLIIILSISILSLENIQQCIPLFLTEVYSETVIWAGILTSIMYAVGSAASILGGVMSDKYDQTLIMISAHLVVTMTTILLAVGHFASGVLLFILVLYGLARYLPVPAQHALSSVTASKHPQGIGFYYTGMALGQIFAAPLIGHLIDTLGPRSAFIVCSIFPCISVVVLWVFRRIRSAS